MAITRGQIVCQHWVTYICQAEQRRFSLSLGEDAGWRFTHRQSRRLTWYTWFKSVKSMHWVWLSDREITPDFHLNKLPFKEFTDLSHDFQRKAFMFPKGWPTCCSGAFNHIQRASSSASRSVEMKRFLFDISCTSVLADADLRWFCRVAVPVHPPNRRVRFSRTLALATCVTYYSTLQLEESFVLRVLVFCESLY